MKPKSKTPAKKAKLSDSELCKTAKQKPGVIDACIISPAEVETAPWVRLKCRFGWIWPDTGLSALFADTPADEGSAGCLQTSGTDTFLSEGKGKKDGAGYKSYGV